MPPPYQIKLETVVTQGNWLCHIDLIVSGGLTVADSLTELVTDAAGGMQYTVQEKIYTMCS